MKIKESTKQLLNYVYLIASLIVAFWFISLFEVFVTFSKGIKVPNVGMVILYKFINDFWTSIIIGALCVPLYWILNVVVKKYGHLIVQILLAVVVLIQFALVKYSSTTLLNLGADLLGYSISDITITVSSSESMSIGYFIPFILAVLVFFGLYKLLVKYVSKKSLIITILSAVVIFGGLKLALATTSEAMYANKLNYLVSDILKFKKEQYELNSFDLSGRSNYQRFFRNIFYE